MSDVMSIARGLIITRDPPKFNAINRNPFFTMIDVSTDEKLLVYIAGMDDELRKRLKDCVRWVLNYEKPTQVPFYQLPKLPILRNSRMSPFLGKNQ